MNILKLTIKNISKKLFFSICSFVIAGSALFFSLFYVSSIEHSVANSIYLSKGEYISYINEESFSNNPINYYERFKEEFDEVIPYVYKIDVISYDYNCVIIGTDLSKNKIYYNEKLSDYDIIKNEVIEDEKPVVYISEDLKEAVIDNIIVINAVECEVGGFLKFKNGNFDEYIVLTSLDTYGEYIDKSIINNDSDSYKYIIDSYYIKNNNDDVDVINEVSMIYNTFDSRYFIDSYDKLFNSQMDEFMLFSSIPIMFFILVSIFSFFNIFVSINLSIEERKKFYSILATLGMKLKHLKQMIIIEMSVISVLASILSILLGLIVSLISISFSNGLTFEFVPFSKFMLALLSIIIIPIIQTCISTKFIKYKQII